MQTVICRPKSRKKKRSAEEEEYDMGRLPKLKRDREARPQGISRKEWLNPRRKS